MTDWQKIKSEFVSGKKLTELAKIYSVPFETIKSRHRKENWAAARSDYKRKLNENVTNKLVEKQSCKVVDEIETIDGVIENLLVSLKSVEAYSLEGIARAICELLKTRGLYSGRTQERKEVNANLNVTNDELYKIAIEAAEKLSNKKISNK